MSSNFPLEDSLMLENLDADIKVLYKIIDKKEFPLLIDNRLHILMIKDKDTDLFITELKKYVKTKIIKKEMKLYEMFDKVLKKKYDGIVCHGLIHSNNYFNEMFISYQDIYKNRNIIRFITETEKEKQGKQSSFTTIKNMMDMNFVYYGRIQDKNLYEKVKDDEGKKTIKMLKLFSTGNLAEEEMEDANVEEYLETISLRNAVENLENGTGVVINCNRSYGISIDKDLLDDVNNRTKFYYNRDNINDRLNYYKNLDECYIIVGEDADYEKNVSTYMIYDMLKKKNWKKTILIFEHYEDACKFIDGNIIIGMSGFYPVGVIKDKELLQKILIRANQNGINDICFDAMTEKELVIPITKVYENLYRKPFGKEKTEIVPIPLKEKPKVKILTEKRKKEIEHLAKQNLMHMIAFGTEEEMLHLLSFYNDKIIEEKTDKRKDKNELNEMSIIWTTILKNLLLKLKDKKEIYILYNEDELLLSKHGYPMINIEARTVENFNDVEIFALCTESIKNLKENFKYILFFNNKNTGCVVWLNAIEKAVKEIEQFEKNKAKILMFLVCKCNLHMEQAMQYFYIMYAKPKLLNEFLSFINNDGKEFPKNREMKEYDITNYVKKENDSKKYEAYLKLIDEICKEKQ